MDHWFSGRGWTKQLMHPTCPPPCYPYQERVSDLSSSAACGDKIKPRSDINWTAWLSRPAEDARTTNAACVHVCARLSRPCLSSSVSARVAEMIASLAYCQNSSVCDMARPSCAPTRPDCHAAPPGQWQSGQDCSQRRRSFKSIHRLLEIAAVVRR